MNSLVVATVLLLLAGQGWASPTGGHHVQQRRVPTYLEHDDRNLIFQKGWCPNKGENDKCRFKRKEDCSDSCKGEKSVQDALQAGENTPKCCMELLVTTLNYVHDLLTKNNITYWAMKGTLLGLIRDKGVIEYDYDIDLGILYDEINQVAALGNQIWADGYVLMQSPWTHYNNMQFVIARRTESVVQYFKDNPVAKDEIPAFTKGLRHVSISAELMAFTKVKKDLVQVLCSKSKKGKKGTRLYTRELDPDLASKKKEDDDQFDAKSAENGGWKTYASSSDKPYEDFVKDSPICVRTAPSSFRYDSTVDMVLEPVLMDFYDQQLYAPKHYKKYLTNYFGSSWNKHLRRYGL